MTAGREYEVLAILNDNFETLSPEQQDHVFAMFAARNKYTVVKTPAQTGSGPSPRSYPRRKRSYS